MAATALVGRATVDGIRLHGVLLNLLESDVPKEVVELLAVGATHLVATDQLGCDNGFAARYMTRLHRSG